MKKAFKEWWWVVVIIIVIIVLLPLFVRAGGYFLEAYGWWCGLFFEI